MSDGKNRLNRSELERRTLAGQAAHDSGKIQVCGPFGGSMCRPCRFLHAGERSTATRFYSRINRGLNRIAELAA
jgi:hypothetical protein